MAWRITHLVTRGVLNNQQKGLVVGTIWLAGRENPLTLELHGNFMRDLAGCELTFVNKAAGGTGECPPLDPVQIGMTGDMTASRKITLEEAPDHKANALYLEWFSETNGRVVIETTAFQLEISAPAWIMTAEDEQAQASANRQAFRDWLEHLSEMEEDDFEKIHGKIDRPMNEFEWEKVLKDSDRKNERLGEVLEKYHGHPDSERLIAREMGWTWVEEEIEAQERGVFAEVDQRQPPEDDDGTPSFLGSADEDDDDLIDGEEYDELREPDPLREGIDWVRDTDGSVEHPLALKALNFSAALWREFEDNGQLGENGDSRIFEWVGMIESAGVRLSTTLGEIAFGEEVETGYLVAGLKRAVNHLHLALDMLQQIEPLNLIDRDRAKACQITLFELREDVIAMMHRYRDGGR